MAKKKGWVRLKRAIQRLKLIQIEPTRGDGAIWSDTVAVVIGGKPPKDSTFIINDNAVVAHPKK